ncbi:MAG: winged helix-turn-helix domain-containing protein [Actinobacteria bacterium]|nr:winged helix-turn-helix domain-containing protein [Actinomycetota bacterium]
MGTDVKTVTQVRRGSLILDVRSRAAFVHGHRVELSPKQFELLAELAARPGEPVRTDELISSVWPDSFGMTSQEVRWHIFRLRQAIGDDKREIVANRRGFGYLVDLAPQEIQLLDPQVSPPTGDEGEPAIPEVRTTQPQAPERSRSGHRKALVFLACGSALILLAGTWVAASRRSESAQESRLPLAPEVAERSQPNPPSNSDDNKRHSQSDKGKGVDRGGSRRSSESGSVVAAFSSGSTDYPAASSETSSSGSSFEKSQDEPGGTEASKEREPPPQPQPNAELFHLYNPDTEDHFLTMSSSTANQKQASGYELTVEGGVFTDQVKGTVAIALDDGTAYVFRDQDMASGGNVAPLYRMEKDSDFFYTSSSSTANQSEAQGWTRATVGYVPT